MTVRREDKKRSATLAGVGNHREWMSGAEDVRV